MTTVQLSDKQKQELRPLLTSTIIKFVISLALSLLMVIKSNKSGALAVIIGFLFGVLYIYTFCSMIQMAKSFTRGFIAAYVTFCVFVFAFCGVMMAISSLLPPFLGFLLSLFCFGAFLFYDIYCIAVIYKPELARNKKEGIVDIPAAVIKVYNSIKSKSANKNNDRQQEEHDV